MRPLLHTQAAFLSGPVWGCGSMFFTFIFCNKHLGQYGTRQDIALPTLLYTYCIYVDTSPDITNTENIYISHTSVTLL